MDDVLKWPFFLSSLRREYSYNMWLMEAIVAKIFYAEHAIVKRKFPTAMGLLQH